MQKLGSERFRLGRVDAEPDDLAPPIRVHSHSDYRRYRDDPSALVRPQIGGVEPEIGPLAGQRAVKELMHLVIYFLAKLG